MSSPEREKGVLAVLSALHEQAGVSGLGLRAVVNRSVRPSKLAARKKLCIIFLR
jgi:hypothetical protein